MKVIKFYKGVAMGLGMVLASMNLTACSNQSKSYDKEIETEINRMIAEGELIDVAAMEEFDKQAAELIEGSDLTDAFSTDENEQADTIPEQVEIPEFVQSSGPDTIEVDGMTYYKIGAKYQPGEYVMVADEGESAYYAIIMDDADHTLIINGGNEHYEVFDTLQGQYITFMEGQIYPISEAPEIKKTTDGAYPEGRYKAGVQIPAGDYVVKGDSVSVTTYAGLSDNDGSIGFCSNVRSAIITVDEGQYIEATWGDLYPLEATTDLKPSDGIYKEGTYKVGFHMPAGTYKLKANTQSAYVQIYNDGYMIGNGDDVAIAEPETNFTVEEGQYVMITGGEAVAQ